MVMRGVYSGPFSAEQSYLCRGAEGCRIGYAHNFYISLGRGYTCEKHTEPEFKAQCDRQAERLLYMRRFIRALQDHFAPRPRPRTLPPMAYEDLP